jgi:preprotein translocase subunit SecG
MTTVVLVVHLLLAVSLIAVVLLQKSEGGALGMGGGGMSGFMTGRSTANLLTRATAVLATLFFVTSIALAMLAARQRAPRSIIDVPESSAPAPTAPGPAANTPAPAPAGTPRGIIQVPVHVPENGGPPVFGTPVPVPTAPAVPAPSTPAPPAPAAPAPPAAPSAPLSK